MTSTNDNLIPGQLDLVAELQKLVDDAAADIELICLSAMEEFPLLAESA